MKRILINLAFVFITGLTAFAQDFQGYADATTVGGGFSYNVQISITQIGERSNALNAAAYKVKLISVNADSKGFYHQGKTNRYFSCAELGSLCDPNKYRDVFVSLNYQCKTNGQKQIRFTGIGQEQTISFRLDPNTKCSFQLDKVKVSLPEDFSMYKKRIDEIEYPQQNNSGIKGGTTTTTKPAANNTNTKPAHFVGTYDKNEGTKKGMCSDRGLVHEAMDIKDYADLNKKFRDTHKGPSTYSLLPNEAALVYEFEKNVAGWGCKIISIGVQKGKSLENARELLDKKIAESPNLFLTKPNILFEWTGTGLSGNTNNPKEEQGGGGNEEDNSNGNTTSGSAGNSSGNKNLPCPTYSFKFSSTPAYNCVALEWWALSTKTNKMDAAGNFSQSSNPEAKSFTIQFRKEGDISWTSERRDNTGRNVHLLKGLDACTKYEVRLITICNNNTVSNPSNIVRFTTACTKPGVLSIENITSSRAKITNARLTAVVTYPCNSAAKTQIRIVEYKTNTGSWEEVICNAGSPCFLNALQPATTYRVRSRYKYGDNLYSNYTNEVSFTTKGQ